MDKTLTHTHTHLTSTPPQRMNTSFLFSKSLIICGLFLLLHCLSHNEARQSVSFIVQNLYTVADCGCAETRVHFEQTHSGTKCCFSSLCSVSLPRSSCFVLENGRCCGSQAKTIFSAGSSSSSSIPHFLYPSPASCCLSSPSSHRAVCQWGLVSLGL